MIEIITALLAAISLFLGIGWLGTVGNKWNKIGVIACCVLIICLCVVSMKSRFDAEKEANRQKSEIQFLTNNVTQIRGNAEELNRQNQELKKLMKDERNRNAKHWATVYGMADTQMSDMAQTNLETEIFKVEIMWLRPTLLFDEYKNDRHRVFGVVVSNVSTQKIPVRNVSLNWEQWDDDVFSVREIDFRKNQLGLETISEKKAPCLTIARDKLLFGESICAIVETTRRVNPESKVFRPNQVCNGDYVLTYQIGEHVYKISGKSHAIALPEMPIVEDNCEIIRFSSVIDQDLTLFQSDGEESRKGRRIYASQQTNTTLEVWISKHGLYAEVYSENNKFCFQSNPLPKGPFPVSIFVAYSPKGLMHSKHRLLVAASMPLLFVEHDTMCYKNAGCPAQLANGLYEWPIGTWDNGWNPCVCPGTNQCNQNTTEQLRPKAKK